MNLAEKYPEEQWPDDLRRAVEAQRRYDRWIWPWSAPWFALIDWLVRRQERRSAPWGAEHYREWSQDELIWRVLFLQGAGRRAWFEREAFRLLVAPLAATAAFTLGLWLGAR